MPLNLLRNFSYLFNFLEIAIKVIIFIKTILFVVKPFVIKLSYPSIVGNYVRSSVWFESGFSGFSGLMITSQV